MKIADILAFKPGQSFQREGLPKTVVRVHIVEYRRDSTDEKNNPIVLNLDYLEFIYNDGALYAGPPIRLNLDIKEIT